MLIIRNDNLELKCSGDRKPLLEYDRISRERIYIADNTTFYLKWTTNPKPNDVDMKYPQLDFLTINISPYSSLPLFCFEENKVTQSFIDNISENFIDMFQQLTKIEQAFLQHGIELNQELITSLAEKYNKKELIENYLRDDDRYLENEFFLKACYLNMQQEIFEKINEEIIENISSEYHEIDLFHDIFLDILTSTEDTVFIQYVLGYIFETEFNKELLKL